MPSQLAWFPWVLGHRCFLFPRKAEVTWPIPTAHKGEIIPPVLKILRSYLWVGWVFHVKMLTSVGFRFPTHNNESTSELPHRWSKQDNKIMVLKSHSVCDVYVGGSWYIWWQILWQASWDDVKSVESVRGPELNHGFTYLRYLRLVTFIHLEIFLESAKCEQNK